jgi:hypothetical protein
MSTGEEIYCSGCIDPADGSGDPKIFAGNEEQAIEAGWTMGEFGMLCQSCTALEQNTEDDGSIVGAVGNGSEAGVLFGKLAKQMTRKTCFVDFDGTLAHFDGWKGMMHFGEPVPAMVEKVKKMITDGHKVVIFTARVVPWSGPEQDPFFEDGFTRADIEVGIKAWCREHLGCELPITGQKMPWDHCWDDSIHSVVRNQGVTVEEFILREVNAVMAAVESGKLDAVAALDQVRETVNCFVEIHTPV